jgi:predicted ATPase
MRLQIFALRKALGADKGLLKTASGRGYRLLGNWSIKRGIASTGDGGLAPESSHWSGALLQTNILPVGSALIGRASAKQRLRDLLSAYRVITLAGPGGIGKTALALEVARDQLRSFEGKVWFVELDALADASLVPTAVAGVLGLRLGEHISAEAVARAIGNKKLLLVLDNCEHVIEAAARLAETIVRMCPHVPVLATSREVLRIEGEIVYRVPPLEVPTGELTEPGHVAEHSAAQLFIARAVALNSAFQPRGKDWNAIATICQQLDGIPLAIELAAALAATHGSQQIAARLNDRFGLLIAGRRTARRRQRTLRSALDWSYELLSEREQAVFRALSIFPAGFTVGGAVAVVGGSDSGTSTVVEDIASLVSKSLVTLEGSASPVRWRMLETIRVYALEKLAESGERERAARRQAVYFRDLFAPIASGPLVQPAIDDMPRHRREIDNVRAALEWALSPGGDASIGTVLTAAYVPVWLHFVLQAECRERMERALDSLAQGGDLGLSVQLRMQLHLALGLSLIFTMGSVERAETALAKSLEAATSLNEVDARLQALWGLWILHLNTGQCRVARVNAERFFDIAFVTDDSAAVLFADRLVGAALHFNGAHDEAATRFERVLERYSPPVDKRHTPWLHFDQVVLARAMLARVTWLRGFANRALEQARVSLDEAQARDYRFSICEALRLAVCPLALLTGDLDGAERAVTVLADLAEANNAPFWKTVGRCLRGWLLISRRDYAAGSRILRAALDTCETSGWTMQHPEFLGFLGIGLAGLGRLTEAIAAVDQAMATAHKGGEIWYVAELLRLKGEFLLREPQDEHFSVAETCFLESIDMARRQSAIAWELRSSLSLAQLRAWQHSHAEARHVLLPVYERFTEGFDTADLRSAADFLRALNV